MEDYQGGVRCNSEGGACLARLEFRAAYNATATRMMAAAAPELAECPARRLWDRSGR